MLWYLLVALLVAAGSAAMFIIDRYDLIGDNGRWRLGNDRRKWKAFAMVLTLTVVGGVLGFFVYTQGCALDHITNCR